MLFVDIMWMMIELPNSEARKIMTKAIYINESILSWLCVSATSLVTLSVDQKIEIFVRYCQLEKLSLFFRLFLSAPRSPIATGNTGNAGIGIRSVLIRDKPCHFVGIIICHTFVIKDEKFVCTNGNSDEKTYLIQFYLTLTDPDGILAQTRKIAGTGN